MAHDLRALSHQWFEELWNQRRPETVDALLDPNGVVHGLSEDGRSLRGPKEFKEFVYPFWLAFPDLRVVVEDVVVEGPKSVIRLSFTGTHTGKGFGLDPTGRRFRATAMIMTVWENGKIIEGWNEFDAATMMRQLIGPGGAKLRV